MIDINKCLFCNKKNPTHKIVNKDGEVKAAACYNCMYHFDKIPDFVEEVEEKLNLLPLLLAHQIKSTWNSADIIGKDKGYISRIANFKEKPSFKKIKEMLYKFQRTR